MILCALSVGRLEMAFKAAREYPEECKEPRLDIDRRIRKRCRNGCNGKSGG